LFSPNHKQFAFVTQKANLGDNSVRFSLIIFSTADAFLGSRPKVITTMASSSNREAISRVTWLADSDHLVFLGENPSQLPQLYQIASSTGEIKRLTNSSQLIVTFSISADG